MDVSLGVSGILLAGFLLKIAGFLVRDELVLRLLVAGGLACDAVFYLLRADPLWQPVVSNLALVSINLALVLLILSERTTWRMSPEDRAVFAHFPTLTPGQFRRLRKGMARRDEAAGAVLLSEAKAVTHLTLVLTGRILIGKGDAVFPIAAPAFVGEIAFLTGNPSSATVTLPEGGIVLRLPIADLRRRMARAPALSNALVALFSRELARKLADSLPMDRAAQARATPVVALRRVE